ncbi:MAG: hypothetical protein WCE46_09380 [Methanoregula sp.]|uniref:hypothetical protein n=1 Tax=Methanoregula sp. TaxID=2052170 RepID=UPI003C7308A8
MKLMRCPGLSYVAVGLVVILCLCAACIFSPSEPAPTAHNNTSVNGGIVQIPGTSSSLNETFTLEDAESAVSQEYPHQVNGTTQNPSFFYIRGEHVDTSGNAQRWIFGIREGNTTSMMVYDTTGVARIALPEGLPAQEIIPANVLSPADIIKIAYPATSSGPLGQNTGSVNMELMNGEYTVTGSSGSAQPAIVINATTGVLIATHD